MSRVVSATKAKLKLGEIVGEVAFGKKDVVIEKHGKPVAVLIPFDHYEEFLHYLHLREQEKKLSPEELKKYEAEGVDIGLLLSSLSKSPTERAETNKELLKFKEEAKKARAKLIDADP